MSQGRIVKSRDKEKGGLGGKIIQIKAETGKPGDTFREQKVVQIGSGLVLGFRKEMQGEV